MYGCGKGRKRIFDVAGYIVLSVQRTDSGRAQASIRLRTAQPIATSAFWAAKERRDVEGRSALLLGKAKDNNASCAIGPMTRLFDDGFTLDDMRRAELTLRVEGEDGFVLDGHSSMAEISRDSEYLVAQTIGRHHQYPDGFMLFLGTLFAPTRGRDVPGEGFTHKVGDRVTIAAPSLGALSNTVRLSTQCPPWTFGASGPMRNLAGRGLL